MHKPLGLAFCLALVGCGNDGLPATQFDLSQVFDFATPPDMASGFFGGTQHAKSSSATVTLPKNSTTDAYDLDGDGTADNKLGAIISGLAALNLDPQAATTAAAQDGSILFLFDESDTDPAFQTDAHAAVTMSVGQKPAVPPKYDGTDAFTVDTSSTPAMFQGAIAAGTFTSLPSATATTPVTATLVLPLVQGQAPIVLPITGAHLTFTRSSNGTVTAGQMNGAIKKTDIDTTVLPAMAALLTQQLPTGGAVIQMFDLNMDGVITASELMSNSLISNFLAPDVQMFQNGVYMPNPAKTQKDSLSMGIAFTGVKATF